MASFASARETLERVLFGPHGLRAGWRIALFVFLAFPFAAAGAVLLRLAGVLEELWVGPALGLVASVASGLLMVVFVDGRRAGALGYGFWPQAPRESAAGFGIGAALLLAAVGLLAVAGTARWVADSGTVPEYAAALARALVFFTVAAAAEEAVFRGYPFQALVQGVGAWPAVLLSSALFAGAHAGNDNVDPLGLLNIFLAGVMLAVAYLRTRSLWFATGVHVGWNWAMSALLDFPVSGFARDTPLYSARETGADWWTGGPFGPEAGVPATLAVLAGTWWMYRTRLLREPPRAREARPLVDDVLGAQWSR